MGVAIADLNHAHRLGLWDVPPDISLPSAWPCFAHSQAPPALPGNALSRSSASTRATGSGASGKFHPRRSLGRST